MKVTAISDLHGNLIDIEPCDLLLICGDISPLEIQKDYIQMTKWIFNDFYKWIMNLSCEKVVITPGNHDFWFEKFLSMSKYSIFNDKLVILVNDEYNFYSHTEDKYIKIFGTPYCKTFGKWAYMPGNEKLENIYNKMSEDIDILITHDSPQIGYVANIMQYPDEVYPNGIPAGNIYLTNTIYDKTPKYVLSGHIHSGDHNLEEYSGTKFANCSILDETYSINYKPLTFEL